MGIHVRIGLRRHPGECIQRQTEPGGRISGQQIQPSLPKLPGTAYPARRAKTASFQWQDIANDALQALSKSAGKPCTLFCSSQINR